MTGEKCSVLDVCHMFLKIQFEKILFDEVLTLSDYHPDYGILAHGCAAGSLVGNHNSSHPASAMCKKVPQDCRCPASEKAITSFSVATQSVEGGEVGCFTPLR